MADSSRPTPGSFTAAPGAHESGSYRNVFAEYGYSPAAIDARVEEAWHTIFEGAEGERFYFDSEDGGGYMLDTGNIDARTEGMSYGMMMAVQMDKKDVFDRLWKWSMDHMFMHDGPNAGYFAWSCQPNGQTNARGPAPDGEEFYAMALFFAANRWGDGEAPFNYSEQARSLLATCVHKGETGEGPGRGPGRAMWDPSNHLIRFIPEVDFSDPSYHLPHFYELFACWANEEDRPFWKKAAEASRAYLPLSCHPKTGLAPEYANFDGTPSLERPDFQHFFSDSYRVAANIGMDALWFGQAPWQRKIADNLLAFFADKEPETFTSYRIDGTPLDRKCLHPVGLVATNAVLALATEGPDAEKALRRFWDTPLRSGDRRYYDNCLYFFALLSLSGRYRIWEAK